MLQAWPSKVKGCQRTGYVHGVKVYSVKVHRLLTYYNLGGGRKKKKRTLTESNCDKTITQILTVDSIRKQRIKRKQILFTKG